MSAATNMERIRRFAETRVVDRWNRWKGQQVNCPACGKRVRALGLTKHSKAAHGEDLAR